MRPESDLRAMQHLVARSDGLPRLLEWLGHRFDASTALIGRSGILQEGCGELPDDVLREAAAGIEQVVATKALSASIDAAGQHVRVVAVDAAAGAPALLVSTKAPVDEEFGTSVSDAAELLGLRWRLEQAERRSRDIAAAEAQVREGVLHLLMSGLTAAARATADVLGPALPDQLCFYIVEGTAATREEIVSRCEQACQGRAWIIRCPVYPEHILILAPVSGVVDRSHVIERALRGIVPPIVVGAGSALPLDNTATSYTQAFHALAVARQRSDHFARFDTALDPAALLGRTAEGWVVELLRPLLDYLPPRAQDPTGAELLATLRDWLDFGTPAARKLKIHRNTLAVRIRHIGELLELDLDRLDVQAQLHLALRLLDLHPRVAPDDRPCEFEEVFGTQAVRQWAGSFLAPLLAEKNAQLMSTLRAWTDSDARAEATAHTLNVSIPTVRKRLARIESLLGRSLMSGPSARYDICLALRILDRTEDEPPRLRIHSQSQLAVGERDESAEHMPSPNGELSGG